MAGQGAESWECFAWEWFRHTQISAPIRSECLQTLVPSTIIYRTAAALCPAVCETRGHGGTNARSDAEKRVANTTKNIR